MRSLPLSRFQLLTLLAFLASWLAVALAPHAHAAEQLYTCGMHPQIIKKAPGNCPICGMKLTPIRGNSAANPPARAAGTGERAIKYYKSTMTPGEVSPTPAKDAMGMDMVPVYADDAGATPTIQIDARTIQRMNLKTAVVGRGPVRREILAVGTVAYNEQGLRDLTTKYEGWIEKLHVNTTWAAVKAGDPLFDIYSPDLYNAQLNYLVARRSEGEAGGPLTRASLERLKLFDVSAEFLADLARTAAANRIYTYRAPADGVVVEKMALVGQMMKPGERIYRLADLSSVWVLAQIYEHDLPFVSQGQDASVRSTYGPAQTLPAKLDLLLPQLDEQTRAVTARLVLDNPDLRLRPGMYVDVRFAAQLAADAVLVPDVAVLRSGERNTVFVALPDGAFEPREIKLGARSAGQVYEVLGGLSAGERIVTSGQFMLDSESQLREAIQKMLNATEGTDSPSGRPIAANASASRALPATPLARLAFAAADAAAALATDDFAAYQKQLPALRQARSAYFAADLPADSVLVEKLKASLSDSADLNAARRDFEPFSTAVADLARENHLHHAAGLHVFECPMSPVLGKARWLQRDAGTRNPFFGSRMPSCGDEIDGPTAMPEASSPGDGGTADLPPGHPPIGRRSSATMSGMDFLRSQMGERVLLAMSDRGADTGAGCTGCGMSAAAMAAGEPCDHPKN